MSYYDTIIIDGNAFFYRSRYAILRRSKNELTNQDGVITTGSYGFLNNLFYILKTYGKPKHLVSTFDAGGGNFRKELDPNYKAGREKVSQNHIQDFRNLVDFILPSMGSQIFMRKGIEADDIIFTLSLDDRLGKTLIVTVDLDLLGCLSERVDVLVFNSAKKKKVWTLPAFEEEYCIPITHYPVYKSIKGDSSDNVKGIKGYGHKRAIKVIQGIVSGSSLEDFFCQKDLFTIYGNMRLMALQNCDPLNFPLLPFNLNEDAFTMMCEDFRFNTFIKRLEKGGLF